MSIVVQMRFLVTFVLCGLPLVLGWRVRGRRIDWEWWEWLESEELQPKLCYRRRGFCIFDWREGWCPKGYEIRWSRRCGYYGVCCVFPPRPITAEPPIQVTTSPPKVTEHECGVSKFGDTMKWRIVGGKDANHGEYPWQVSILYRGVHWCGGTLINREWVMTAAHCFISKPARDFSIILGQHRLDDNDRTEQHFNISKVIDHPEYHIYDTEHDLSLVKLNHVATYNDYVIPACLPDGREEIFEGMFCTVTGWGHTAENGLRSNVLKEVTVPVVTREICAQRLESKGEVYGTNICAGYDAGGKDACQSDSGGPLNCRKLGENWKVAGVVSWGDGCGKAEKPGVYTSVAAYSEWIKKTIAAN